MPQKPSVFISSTGDLRSARDLVGKVLHSMGYEPVWQDVEPTDGGELLDVLRRWMEPCGLMIQLVGRRYGAEPPAGAAPAGFGRVSYTQFEAMHFEGLGRKVIYVFLKPAFPTDPAPPEPPELADLQAAYRTRIQQNNRLHQDNIATAQDLELSVRRVRDELAVFRLRSEARERRMLLLSGGAAAGIAVVAALVAGGVRLLRRGQAEQANKIDRQAATVDRQAARADDQSQQLARIEKLLLAQKQANPQAEPKLSDADLAMLEAARQHGGLKARAAASVLSPDAGTDALLAELQARHDAEAFDLAMLQGKRWYFDRVPQCDKAVPPFERAVVLRPDSLEARTYAASVHTLARLGDIAVHRRRAIEIAEGTLQRVPSRSAEWARVQNILGFAWSFMPTGDRAENLRRAVAAFDAALTVFTRDADPDDWAATQGNLGMALADLPTGDRGENLRRAIAAYDAALTVRTREAYPAAWLTTQINLGIVWQRLPTGDRAGNVRRAIAAYEAALAVATRDDYPAEWAAAQIDLGSAWADLPTGDRGENLRRAIAAYDAALTVCTRDADPAGWARAQNNLGTAWLSLPSGDRGENLRRAIAAFDAALTVRTRDADPAGWAKVQINLGNAWRSMPTGDTADNVRRSIAAYQAALTVLTRDAEPAGWGMTQIGLGGAWAAMPTGDRGENMRRAVAACDAALAVFTRDAYPAMWAAAQDNLGGAWRFMPTGDRGENLRRAVAAYDDALTVFTRDADPVGWGRTQHNRAACLFDLSAVPGEDRCGRLRQAIGCGKAVLRVYTAEAFPREHAEMVKIQEIFRAAYESAGCAAGAAGAAFDDIPPAE